MTTHARLENLNVALVVPLEDVLHDLIQHTAEPDYGSLNEWSRRYPQHAEAFTEFFEIWGDRGWQNHRPAGK